MSKNRKRISSLVLALALSLTAAGSTSAALPYDKQTEIYRATGEIAGTMQLILENYAGGDVTTDQLYDAAMRGMMDALDEYSVYLSGEEVSAFLDYFAPEGYGIGILTQYDFDGNLFISRVYANSPAEKAGLKKGDVILKINGQKTKGKYWEEIESFYALNKAGIKLVISRDGQEKEISAQYANFVAPTVFVSTVHEKTGKPGYSDKIRYMEMTSVSDDTANELKRAMDKMKAEGVTKVILDLRGNGGGSLDVAVKICDMLVPKGAVLTTVSKTGEKTVYKSNLEKAPFEKMIVLTDRYTASAGETIAGALQDAKTAVLIGETTFGKGVVQSIYGLADGSAIKLTTEEYFRRSGAAVNEKGITPNISVPLLEAPYEADGIKPGESAADIPAVKQALKLLGYATVNTDNVFDQWTVTAVKAFQTNRGLKATGELNYVTLLEINAALYQYYTANDVILNKALQEIGK